MIIKPLSKSEVRLIFKINPTFVCSIRLAGYCDVMHNKPIIQLLEENELNISLLYSLYAKKIPAKSAFWQQLSEEEVAHAAAINADSAGHDLDQSIVENNFSRGIVNHIMSFVLEESQKAESSETTHFDALYTALRIERSMLEKKCFDMFAPTNTTIKELFEKLNADTEKHVQLLMDELKSISLEEE